MKTACAPSSSSAFLWKRREPGETPTAFIEIWCEIGWTPYSTDRSHLQPSSSVERVAHREHRLFLPDGQITFASGIGISNASKIFRLIARPFACGVELGSGFRIETKIDRIHQNVGDISQKRLDLLFIF